MFDTDRSQLRKIFFESWKYKQQGRPMEAIQKIVATIIAQHPEYHSLLENEAALDQDFQPDQGSTNPFLHMSMHITLHEQVSTDRPQGIKACYQKLTEKTGSVHEAEHEMMECLGESLWLAQREQRLPDEQSYLDCLRKLANITKL